MNEKNRAILLLVNTKPSHVKPKAQPRVTVTQKDDGKAEWVRFKSECVLLIAKKKGAGK
jgi:hypothetical protein